jgi:hypothetical protein
MGEKAQFYQIYTYGSNAQEEQFSSLSSWDLHAQVECRESCLLHAKMLALNPSYDKIQVEQIDLCENSGRKKARTIKTFQRKAFKPKWQRLKNLLEFLKTRD